MTLQEMKEFNKEIKRLSMKLVRLRSAAVNISPSMSGMPGGGSEDKLSSAVAEIADTEQRLAEIRAVRNYYLDKLSVENYTENCIWLHIARGYSWRKIANQSDGRPDTEDAIRKRCYRYEW